MSIRKILQISNRKLFHQKTTDLNLIRQFSALPQENPRSKVEYYKVLGVPPNATLTEIREAYFRKVKQCHPDINPSQEAKNEFILVRQAYKVLADVDRRVGYDRTLSKKSASSMEVQDQESQEEYDLRIKRKQETQEMMEKLKREFKEGRGMQYWTPFQERFAGARNIKLNQFENRHLEKLREAKRQEIRSSEMYQKEEELKAYFRRFDIGGPKALDGADFWKGDWKFLLNHITKYTGIVVATIMLSLVMTINGLE